VSNDKECVDNAILVEAYGLKRPRVSFDSLIIDQMYGGKT